MCYHITFFPLLLPHHPLQKSCSVPLDAAAQKGHLETVKTLLEGGANINHKDKVWNACTLIFHSTWPPIGGASGSTLSVDYNIQPVVCGLYKGGYEINAMHV